MGSGACEVVYGRRFLRGGVWERVPGRWYMGGGVRAEVPGENHRRQYNGGNSRTVDI